MRFSRGPYLDTPRETACVLSENAIQHAVFDNIRVDGAAGVFAFHPRNGSHDQRSLAGINNGLGVVSGVPDVSARPAATEGGPSYRLAVLFGILLAIMSLTMGRGLSQLQKDILAYPVFTHTPKM